MEKMLLNFESFKVNIVLSKNEIIVLKIKIKRSF